jgi:hypothetical protein
MLIQLREDRIEQICNRESTVIHPLTQNASPYENGNENGKSSGFVIASRQTHKRIDLVAAELPRLLLVTDQTIKS